MHAVGSRGHHLADGGARAAGSVIASRDGRENRRIRETGLRPQSHHRLIAETPPSFSKNVQAATMGTEAKGAGGPAAPASNAWARGQKVPTQNQSQPAGQRGADGIPADYMMNQATKEFVAAALSCIQQRPCSRDETLVHEQVGRAEQYVLRRLCVAF